MCSPVISGVGPPRHVFTSSNGKMNDMARMITSRRRITPQIRRAVFERDSFTCQYCGYKGTGETLHLDHIKPMMLGGTDDIDNLATACPNCNMLKGARDLSDYLTESISKNTKFHQTFVESMASIENLVKVDLDDPKLAETLNRLLFANTVAAMETYLSDAFINTVVNNPELIRKFMETTPAFNDKKYKLSEIYDWVENTKRSVMQYLLDIIYHNVFVVKNMYKCALDIDFPEDMEPIQKAVMIRHDIVHRNGKTKTGKVLNITDEDVMNNIEVIKSFINHIDGQLKTMVRSNPLLGALQRKPSSITER
jgi:5-methylcytosine-specific restriction endonuclease McrA/uncharacterized protein YutE (UPF0331/DUF86 family)